MTRYQRISPELLGVYASLVYVIGSLITLAASIITYRQSRRPQLPESPEAAGAEIPFLIR